MELIFFHLISAKMNMSRKDIQDSCQTEQPDFVRLCSTKANGIVDKTKLP